MFSRHILFCTENDSESEYQNSLLVKRQTDNTTPGEWGLTGGDYSRALTREVNLDTQSSDNSAEEIDTGYSPNPH